LKNPVRIVSSLTLLGQGTIVACCREPDETCNLNKFKKSLDSKSQRRIQILPLDLQYQSSIKYAGRQIRDQFQRVDMLLNVADMLASGQTTPDPDGLFSEMDHGWREKITAVNFLAPIFLTMELLPLLIQKRKPSTVEQRPKAVIVNIPNRVGSSSDYDVGTLYSYRPRMLALQQATRRLASKFRLRSACAVALHPGTTDTDLSKPFQIDFNEEPFCPVDLMVKKLSNIIDSLQDVNSGGFYDWSGRAVSFSVLK
jgi:NAD(P)-dependent dehydrogenase (short-subunit alcohol dehydrogenase family)